MALNFATRECLIRLSRVTGVCPTRLCLRMCGEALPRRFNARLAMGCAHGPGYAPRFGPKAERGAEPRMSYKTLAPRHSLRRTSGGVAAAKGKLNPLPTPTPPERSL